MPGNQEPSSAIPSASRPTGVTGEFFGLKGKAAGFTLVELIAAAGIVAILAVVAYPSYMRHIATARRSDAQGALLGLAAAMERHATTHGFSYTGAAGTKDAPADSGSPWIYAQTVPVSGGTVTYNLNIAASTDTSFILEAVPTGPQTGDRCGTLTLTSAGIRGIKNAQAGLAASDCWRN